MVNDLHVYHLSEGWTTFLGDALEVGTAAKHGQRLSKKITSVVLSVEYFDDDMLRVALFQGGKRVALHQTDNGYGLQHKGNPVKFLEHLGYSIEEAPLLKEVFRCGETELLLGLLQDFLGLALWIDERILKEEGPPAFRRTRNLPAIEAYRLNQKQANRVRNQTRLKLITEMEGAVRAKHLMGIPPFNRYEKQYETEYIFRHSNDGKLIPLWDAKPLQYDIYSGHHLLFGHGRFAFFSDRCYLFSDQGTPLTSYPYPLGAQPILLLPDGGFLASEYSKSRRGEDLYEFGPDGEERWRISFIGRFHIPTLYGHFRYVHDYHAEMGVNRVYRLNEKGESVACYHLPRLKWDSGTWMFQDPNGMIYIGCYLEAQGPLGFTIFRLTETLAPAGEITIGTLLPKSISPGALSPDGNLHALIVGDHEMLLLDWERGDVTCRRKLEGGDATILHFAPSNRILVLRHDSVLELYDVDFTLISRHRVKGYLSDSFIDENGSIHLLTSTGGLHEEQGSNIMKLRTYEITG
ncbi:hypothetical protein [Gorillibacterium sp. sgz5001074]|uniref:hypothetical protein n=1 Tax=Gorillibacterium sp. sgz5001074 TaxID=3446695 RepID=UPI003F6819D7